MKAPKEKQNQQQTAAIELPKQEVQNVEAAQALDKLACLTELLINAYLLHSIRQCTMRGEV
jgi:hypothetical protein